MKHLLLKSFLITAITLLPIATNTMVPGGPMVMPDEDVIFPSFATWSAEQRELAMPEELITDAEYAQTLRKQVANKYRNASIQKYNAFVNARGGEGAMRARGTEPIDAYKNYLLQRMLDLKQEAEQGEEKEEGARHRMETFAQAHQATAHFGDSDDRYVPLGRRIIIKTLTGLTKSVDPKPSDTWADLKEKIYAETGILPEEQRIVNAGKVVNSIRELGNITNDTKDVTFVRRIPQALPGPLTTY